MTLGLRFALPDDGETIADFVLAAGDGVFEQLFEGIVPGLRARDIVRMAITEEGSSLSYRHALLAEDDGAPLGCAVFYPAADYGLPAIAKTMIPKARLAPVAALLASRVEGALYLNTLAVAPAARGRGIGPLLLATVREIAAERGFAEVCLHAWADNEAAMALYRDAGFVAVDEIAVGETAYLKHRAPMVLMRAASVP